MDTGLFQVSFGLIFDSLTATMLIVVTSVSSLVHIYSTEYMRGDPHLPRFMSYLSLFTFFMFQPLWLPLWLSTAMSTGMAK